MKSTFIALICVCLYTTLMLLQSCEVDVGEPSLVADAGEDLTAAPLTSVQLDGTASTPTGQIQYEWEFSGGPVDESKINLTDATTGIAKFTPPKNGIYYFTLTITRGIQFMTDQVTVTVDGVITLESSSQNITLVDIEPDGSKPDYKLNSILALSETSRMSVDPSSTQGIVIDCSESAGVSIASGNHTLSGIKFTSTTGWKGIMIKAGSQTISQITLEKAGKGLFDGATENAAVTITGGTVNMTYSAFDASTGYDLLITNSSFHTISSNQFKSAKPVKIPVSAISTLYSNTFPDTYDYITLTTPGASTYVSSADGQSLRFASGRKFYIDGDLTASSQISIESGATILMKENAGIVASGGISCAGSTKPVIQGINSSSWKGIVLGTSSSTNINGLVLRDAGSQVFNTGSITTDFKAAIHVNGTAALQNVEIISSKGYGISYNGVDSPNGIVNNTFTDGVSPAIRIQYHHVHFLLRDNHNSTFTMPAGVAAVELTGSSIGWTGTAIWRALNGNNFYLANGNIVLNGNLTLSPGVRVKFASSRSLTGSTKFVAVGTANAPIILEGTNDAPGAWPGMLLEGPFNIEFCQIKFGGQSMMLGASAAAALVIKYTGTVTADNFTFKNNTVTGSSGLGVLVELGAKDPGVDTPANNNSYSNNTGGNTLKK